MRVCVSSLYQCKHQAGCCCRDGDAEPAHSLSELLSFLGCRTLQMLTGRGRTCCFTGRCGTVLALPLRDGNFVSTLVREVKPAVCIILGAGAPLLFIRVPDGFIGSRAALLLLSQAAVQARRLPRALLGGGTREQGRGLPKRLWCHWVICRVLCRAVRVRYAAITRSPSQPPRGFSWWAGATTVDATCNRFHAAPSQHTIEWLPAVTRNTRQLAEVPTTSKRALFSAKLCTHGRYEGSKQNRAMAITTAKQFHQARRNPCLLGQTSKAREEGAVADPYQL